MTTDTVLLGSGRFAKEVFSRAIEKGLLPKAIFTYPPKEKGRGHRLRPDPVQELADEKGIPVFLFDDFSKDSEAFWRLRELSPDLGIVLSFKILPAKFFTIPRNGMMNLHPSLLPDLRGAAPLNWAIARGYKHSGISTFILNNKVDSGGIIKQTKFDISPSENVLELTLRIVEPAAELIIDSIPLALDDDFVPKIQSPENATRAPKIEKKHLKIDLNTDNHRVHNHIRAFFPASFSYYNTKKVSFLRSSPGSESGPPGEILGLSGDSIIIGCDSSSIHIEKIKPEGKREMTGRAFANGYAKDNLGFS